MKKFIWIVLLLIAIGAVYALYLFNKPHRDIASEKPEVEIAAGELVAVYASNTSAGDSLYLDRVIRVEGAITAMEENALVIDEGIYCVMDSTANIEKLAKGFQIALKGRVIGYDELFEQVKLDNCFVIEALKN